jgi:hypothetical protein
MSDHKRDRPQGQAEQKRRPDQPSAPHVDVEKLADKVYQLMLADVRLARARQDG